MPEGLRLSMKERNDLAKSLQKQGLNVRQNKNGFTVSFTDGEQITVFNGNSQSPNLTHQRKSIIEHGYVWPFDDRRATKIAEKQVNTDPYEERVEGYPRYMKEKTVSPAKIQLVRERAETLLEGGLDVTQWAINRGNTLQASEINIALYRLGWRWRPGVFPSADGRYNTRAWAPPTVTATVTETAAPEPPVPPVPPTPNLDDLRATTSGNSVANNATIEQAPISEVPAATPSEEDAAFQLASEMETRAVQAEHDLSEALERNGEMREAVKNAVAEVTKVTEKMQEAEAVAARLRLQKEADSRRIVNLEREVEAHQAKERRHRERIDDTVTALAEARERVKTLEAEAEAEAAAKTDTAAPAPSALDETWLLEPDDAATWQSIRDNASIYGLRVTVRAARR